MIAIRLKPAASVSWSAAVSDAPSTAAKTVSGWSTLPGGVVDDSEIVLLAIKPSMWRPVFDSAAWLVTTGVLAAVLLILGAPFPGLTLALTAQAVLLIGVLRLAVAILRWIPTWYVLTNRRVLDIHGVRSPRISSCTLLEVRNTYLTSSIPEKLATLGSITYVTDHPDQPPRVWESVSKPELVHDKVRRAIEHAIDYHGL